MDNFSMIDSIEYSDKSFLLRIADQSLTPLRVMCNGRHVHLDEETTETEHKTHHLALRFFAGLLVLVTLPVTLIALTVKWWKQEEWQQVLLEHLEQKEFDLMIQESKEVFIPEEQEKFIEFIQQELAQVHALNEKLPAPLHHSWREYGVKIGENNETLASYIDRKMRSVWPNRCPLYIQCIGTFNETDLKIVSITADYLRVSHNIPVKLCKNMMTIEQLKENYLQVLEEDCQKRIGKEKPLFENWMRTQKKRIETSFPRTNGQYDADMALELIRLSLKSEFEKDAKEKVQAIVFTSEDLFAEEMSNFVFGCGSLGLGVGIWSNARFGDPSSSSTAFEKCLLRMMKISNHEFGHMQGLPHCTDYECNIGGCMSLKEMDSSPLLYCLQDTAKICYLTHTSLLEHQRKVLEFYQNFNKTYEFNCDFSKEISVLQNRIRYLSKHE